MKRHRVAPQFSRAESLTLSCSEEPMAAPLQARTFVGPKSLGHCQLISTLDLALALNARQALTWPAPNSSPQHRQHSLSKQSEQDPAVVWGTYGVRSLVRRNANTAIVLARPLGRSAGKGLPSGGLARRTPRCARVPAAPSSAVNGIGVPGPRRPPLKPAPPLRPSRLLPSFPL